MDNINCFNGGGFNLDDDLSYDQERSTLFAKKNDSDETEKSRTMSISQIKKIQDEMLEEQKKINSKMQYQIDSLMGVRSRQSNGEQKTSTDLENQHDEEDERKKYAKIKENKNNEDSKSYKVKLDNDTFTLMIRSEVISREWFLGLTAWSIVICLVCLIIVGEELNQGKETGQTIWNIPINVRTTVRIGQFLVSLLCLFTSRDVVASIHHMVILAFPGGVDSNSSRTLVSDHWKEVFKKDTDATSKVHVFFPLFLKFVEGFLVLLVSSLIIVRATNIIDLLKDYTALVVVSEIDDVLFMLAGFGYFGKSLQKKASESEDIELRDEPYLLKDLFGASCCKWDLRTVILMIVYLVTFTLLSIVVYMQSNFVLLDQKYPDCKAVIEVNGRTFTSMDLNEMSNGKCDNFRGKATNIKSCGYEDNECRNFNLDFSQCNSWVKKENEDALDYINNVFFGKIIEGEDNDTNNALKRTIAETLKSSEDIRASYGVTDTSDIMNSTLSPLNIGDRNCDSELNITECSFDGFDCLDKSLEHPCKTSFNNNDYKYKLGDGVCDLFLNTEACGYDLGDCIDDNTPKEAFAFKCANGARVPDCSSCPRASPPGKLDEEMCGGDCIWNLKESGTERECIADEENMVVCGNSGRNKPTCAGCMYNMFGKRMLSFSFCKPTDAFLKGPGATSTAKNVCSYSYTYQVCYRDPKKVESIQTGS